MAEKPIIFSGPMVRAIIDGRKTMTRRIIKGLGDFPITEYDGMYMWRQGYRWGAVSDPKFPPGVRFAVGDRLWVRETCRAYEKADGTDVVLYEAGGEAVPIQNTPEAASAWVDLFHYRGRREGCAGNKVPAIHMPRWASRITLRVTKVRVQRLQDITEEDAKAEGSWPPTGYKPGTRGDFIGGFAFIWEGIHGPGSWDINPWVAAITFERAE